MSVWVERLSSLLLLLFLHIVERVETLVESAHLLTIALQIGINLRNDLAVGVGEAIKSNPPLSSVQLLGNLLSKALKNMKKFKNQ